MTDWEIYWDTVSRASAVGVTFIRAYFFWRFVTPFLRNRKYAPLTGISYGAVMLILIFWPDEIHVMTAYTIGVAAAFAVMYLTDKRNVEQKIFLAVTFYLLKWITWGVILVPWQTLYGILLNVFDYFGQLQRLALYAVMEILDLAMHWLVLAFCVRILHREYQYKSENMTKRELALMLAPLLSVIAGQGIFQFAVDVYEKDTGQYIWNNHYGYSRLQALFLLISFAAMLTVIVSYQRIKSSQREEKENAVLAGQIEEIKRHIREVEKLYLDVRSFRHDMGNHIMTLEKLCEKNKEAETYMAQMKEQVSGAMQEIKSGNPVTDVILREKQKEADEKGIIFENHFHFPENTEASVFDISIILNNALNNALEAAGDCDKPRISVSSWRQKNACMIEIENSMSGKRYIEEESGLPVTTKKGTEHGFGLANIRKVARKYYGDIAIEQTEGKFKLTVMLMAG